MSAPTRNVLLDILELGRWAPSGDNTQPWRFEIVADDHVVVHGHDTRDEVVYDLDGHASQLSLGTLLETIRIAATKFGLETLTERRLDMPDTRPTFDLRFVDRRLPPSELIECITTRSVQRKPFSTRRLSAEEKQALQASVGPGYRLGWLESGAERLHMARLWSRTAKLRLTLPEAFEVHRVAIEANVRFSPDRVPDQAVGLDALTLKLMHWAMRDWRRMSFLNKYLAGTLAPRLQLDLIPAMACAAHVYVMADQEPTEIDHFVAAGGAVQRFWLTLTKLGLRFQPAMTPLIFSRYARRNMRFSKEDWAMPAAAAIANALNEAIGAHQERIVWLGRIGQAAPPVSRSLRLPLEQLLKI